MSTFDRIVSKMFSDLALFPGKGPLYVSADLPSKTAQPTVSPSAAALTLNAAARTATKAAAPVGSAARSAFVYCCFGIVQFDSLPPVCF